MRCFADWNGLGCVCNACRQIEAIENQTKEIEKARVYAPTAYTYDGPIRERTLEEQKQDEQLKQKWKEQESLAIFLGVIFVILAFLLIPSIIGFLFRVY